MNKLAQVSSISAQLSHKGRLNKFENDSLINGEWYVRSINKKHIKNCLIAQILAAAAPPVVVGFKLAVGPVKTAFGAPMTVRLIWKQNFSHVTVMRVQV